MDGRAVARADAQQQTQLGPPSRLHTLPPYNSDDAFLVRAIEDNILDGKQFVSFADIASLDDAKRLLKEAVIVPLLLPDFFTGPSSARPRCCGAWRMLGWAGLGWAVL